MVIFTSPSPLRRTPCAEYTVELVDFRITREERVEVEHLGEDASDAPNVDPRGVVGGAEEDLGGTVPIIV